MNTDPSTPENDANLSGLGRALLETGSSKPSSGPWIPPTAEELGKLLPEYEILKMLGRGGMGAVYMGKQISLDRPVAIKILSGTLEDSDMGFKERFKNEAKAMGKLNHPGIVAVHDFGEAKGGLLYIVMEYVEGTDVARMIAKEGRLHTEHAMAITAHVCDALAYAHDRGIIHRDIKPANIMVGYDGVVKVADFGLAKMTHSNSTGLTQSGMTMGTLHYMAPECLMLGSAVDHRADIYAVGVMLYQMLTGKLPQGAFELPSLQIAGLDPRYDQIIAKGLREDREVRYQSIRDMRGDLDAILTQPVAKVEPEVSQAPAALPTQVRPQRPGARQPNRPQQSVVQHKPAKKTSSALFVWATVGLLTLGGAYWFFIKGVSQSGPLNRSEAEIASHGQPGGRAERGNPLSGTNSGAVTNPPTTTAQGTVRTTLSAAASSTDAASAKPPPAALSSTPAIPAPVASAKPRRIDGLVADGQWQDVLKRIGEKPEVRVGPWSFENGILTCTESYPNASIAIPSEVISSYSARLRFVSKDFGNLVVILPTPGGRITFAIHTKKRKVGWLTPPGPSLESWPLKHEVKDGREHELLVEVTPDRLQAKIDGLLAFDQANPTWTTIQQPPGYPPGTARQVLIGVGAEGGAVEFRGFEILIPSRAGSAASLPVVTKTPPDFNFQQLPDFRTRVTNYRKARHAQLAELTTKYRSALTAEKDAAIQSGVLASVTACDAAIANAADFAQVIEQNLTATEVKPLPALATAADSATPRLEELRDIFVREVAKIENTLITSLDQSLATVQASLVQADKLTEARAVEDYRKNMLAVFKTGHSAASSSIAAAPQTNGTTSNPAEATKDRPFVNSLGMKFVPVPITGGPTDGKTLLFSVWETRVRDYAEFSKSNALSDSSWENASEGGATQNGDHPVVNVSWDDAVGFCEWLGKKDGFICRLPSDHEWSCAGGLGLSENPVLKPVEKRPKKAQAVSFNYPWGSSDQPPFGFANYKGTQTDAFIFTAPVGSFPATAEGLHDLWGNVSEWCADWHDPAAKGQRVIRGHSWDNWGNYRASSQRITIPYGGDGKTVGFRVVLEIPVTTTPTSSSVPSAPTNPQVPVTTGPTVNLLQATKDRPFVNSLGMKFVPVPGTKVLMCIHETRYKDYASYANEVPGVDGAWKDQSADGFTPTDRPEDHPVIKVSWEDAQKFCAWLSKKEGKTYRLPTDQEWSIAVGIGRDEKWKSDTTPATVEKNQTEFPWGDQWPPPKGSGNFSDDSRKAKAPIARVRYLEGYDDGFPTTAPVMSFKPNNFGLYDLECNVREWAEDWWDNAKADRVLRGGCWNDYVRGYVLSSSRTHLPPGSRRSILGFRVVVVVSGG